MSDNFTKSITTGSVVLLVGTGVSAGLTGGIPTATWVGLLRSGITRAEVVNSGLVEAGWRSVVETQLDFGARQNNASMLIGAANLIADAMKGVGARAYAEWLESTVGSLVVTNPRLGAALRGIPFPILTTNYDTLIEQATNRSVANWPDCAAIQRLLMGGDSSVGHLHGVWSEPDSVVLTQSDYNALLAAEPLQHLQRAIGR